MTFIYLSNPTNRNTELRDLYIGGLCITFSYETPIAFSGCINDDEFVTYRRPNRWGRTTGKHFRKSNTASYDVIEDEYAFLAQLTAAIRYATMRPLIRRLAA